MGSAANNVLAATFLLPQGWQYQGQIVWMHEFSVLAKNGAPRSDAKVGWFARVRWISHRFTDLNSETLQPLAKHFCCQVTQHQASHSRHSGDLGL